MSYRDIGLEAADIEADNKLVPECLKIWYEGVCGINAKTSAANIKM